MLIVMPEGHDYVQEFQVRDAQNDVVDLTGCTAISFTAYVITELFTGAPSATFTWTLAAGHWAIDADPTTGLVTLTVQDSAIDGLAGRYQWEAKATISGDIINIGGGDLHIFPTRQDGA
jgi:hypothetical protein